MGSDGCDLDKANSRSKNCAEGVVFFFTFCGSAASYLASSTYDKFCGQEKSARVENDVFPKDESYHNGVPNKGAPTSDGLNNSNSQECEDWVRVQTPTSDLDMPPTEFVTSQLEEDALTQRTPSRASVTV